LLLENPASLKTQTATVVFVKHVGNGEFDVGVEFTQSDPTFWGAAFPPVN
jgi:hypothetical protein